MSSAKSGSAYVPITTGRPFGNVDLLVPEGVEVEVQAGTQMGRTDVQASSGRDHA